MYDDGIIIECTVPTLPYSFRMAFILCAYTDHALCTLAKRNSELSVTPMIFAYSTNKNHKLDISGRSLVQQLHKVSPRMCVRLLVKYAFITYATSLVYEYLS